MSAGESRNGRETDSVPESGILGALPRTRPQRASARRTAARNAAGASKAVSPPAGTSDGGSPSAPETATARDRSVRGDSRKARPTRARGAAQRATPATSTKRAPGAGRPSATGTARATQKAAARQAAAKQTGKPAEPPAPKQGYEPEDELELGKTVNPPSGVELVESVADIVGELANSSLAAGGRLLRDAFSLLRRP